MGGVFSDREGWHTTLVFAAGLFAFYGLWLAIWLGDGALYFRALHGFGIDAVVLPGHAAPLVFFDLEGVLSWPECARRGFDVFVTNPCDRIGRLANYSPLLAHPLLGGIGIAGTQPIGLAVDVAFLALLPFVVQPRSFGEVAMGWAVAGSPVFIFALDRCNLDVIVFLVAALVILVASRPVRLRATTIAGFVLGFVKFYPFCLLLLAVRERLRTFLAILGLAAAALALFMVVHHHAFAAMSFPGPDWFGDTFSARQVVLGLGDIFGIPAQFLLPVLAVPIMVCALLAWKLSRRLDVVLPPRVWQEREYLLLLFAAVVMVSCFVLQANLNYRAVFLAAALPGLWRLRAAAEPGLKRLVGWTMVALVACLWAEMARANLALAVEQMDGAGRAVAERALAVATLAVREPLWWFEMSVLAAIVLSFVRQSRAVRQFAALVRRAA